MKTFSRSLAGIVVITCITTFASLAGTRKADSLDGRWDATVTIKGVVIPFRLDIAGRGNNITGTLFNGEQKQTTTSSKRENGTLVLNFEHYLTKIIATLKNG
jgi:hypothetical protein